jgi:hypothetical protein
MSSQRLLCVIIATPRKLQGPDLRTLSAVKAEECLRLDAPHQIVVEKVPSFVDLPEPFTSVTFRYSNGYADSADYNDGPGDIEGEIVALVKAALNLKNIIVNYEKFDGRRW